MGILAGHLDLVTALGMGRASIVTEQGTRYAACIGGLLSVQKDQVTLVATTFEWAEDIDAARAQASYERAQKVLHSKDAGQVELKLAEARLKRALVRRTMHPGGSVTQCQAAVLCCLTFSVNSLPFRKLEKFARNGQTSEHFP